MSKIAFALLIAVFALAAMPGAAVAQDTCRSKAIGKDGKPLAGAALNSFLAKCKQGMPVSRRRSTRMVRNSPGLQKAVS